MEQHICKNCNNTFSGNYCNNCGQHADIKRIGHGSIWNDIKYGLFHYNSKVGYTTKQLLLRPGHTIREYIEGKRVKHFQPLSYVVILTGIYALLHHFFHIEFIKEKSGISENFDTLSHYVNTHYEIAILASIPLFAVCTYIAFRKQGYHFMEHIVINSFIAGQKLLFSILTFPLLYITNHTPAFDTTSSILSTLEHVLMIWSLAQIFKQLPTAKLIGNIVVTFLLYLLEILIFALIIYLV